MFEEDFERCFICQVPCKGLYCSSECRHRDKGTPSPAIKAAGAPARLTAQLPVSLSPLARPQYTISPAFGPRRRGNSSSSSSISDSPIHSPHTNASASESPQKESFNLPPPAYPIGYGAYGSLGTTPMKIPSLASRVPSNATSGATTPGSQYMSLHPMGASVDTLRFGRKPSVTNSVTSPVALLPRCGCGRALGHRARSRERDGAEGISCLSLGPSQTSDDNPHSSMLRMAHEPAHRMTAPRTPNFGIPTLQEERSINHVLGSSLLSRSRSDPSTWPRQPKEESQRALGIHPKPTKTSPPLPQTATLPPVTRQSSTGTGTLPSDDRRGRSRERLNRTDLTPELGNVKLVHHEEREVAPSRTSRSRGRNNSDPREREREPGRWRSRSRARDIREELPQVGNGLGLNLAPTMRRGTNVEAERGRAGRVAA